MSEFAQRYRAALSAYSIAPGEDGLSEAYALGREAVGAGMSLLDLTVVHQQATEKVVSAGGAAGACNQFFLEALSTFDMAQRGYLEAHERARAEREYGQRLARLNQAVVAVSSVPGYVQRLAAVVAQSQALVGAWGCAAFFDASELTSTRVGQELLADARVMATKVRLNDRGLVEEPVDWSPHWMLGAPIGQPKEPSRGAIVLWRTEPFTREEIATVEQFARYVAMALDIAVRFEQEHELAIALQRAMLPPAPPAIEGLEVAWRYQPAEARDIGGDWYDVFNLDGGEAVLVVGDVMGHDVRAAAVMGQLRLALQAYALDGYKPQEVLDRADRLLQRIDPGSLATVAYAVISPDRRRLRLSNAGHPPPLLVVPQSDVSLLDGALSVPLGIDVPGGRHREAEYPLRSGSRIVLYTDGLVEDRVRTLSDGLNALMKVASEDTGPLEELCEQALAVRGQSRDDDVCVLCVAVD